MFIVIGLLLNQWVHWSNPFQHWHIWQQSFRNILSKLTNHGRDFIFFWNEVVMSLRLCFFLNQSDNIDDYSGYCSEERQWFYQGAERPSASLTWTSSTERFSLLFTPIPKCGWTTRQVLFYTDAGKQDDIRRDSRFVKMIICCTSIFIATPYVLVWWYCDYCFLSYVYVSCTASAILYSVLTLWRVFVIHSLGEPSTRRL